MTTNKLTCDGDIYLWNGSLTELKCFVEQILKLQGKCSSPGGDVKLFCDNESKFSIKWYGQRSRKLIIQTDSDEHYLKLEFQKLACTYEDNNPDADENFVNLITDISGKKDVYTADEESQVISLERLMEVEVTDVNKQNHETVSCVVDRNVKCIAKPE
ncbi:Hypothetical predicted protein [Paramuricea clavata]|uniref:Uncharacterized protein n=1 Tax=Paramuricea clavata TaxID=317549 RepID=A0A6S7IVF0_PARCT|nr:Hypothetical predicted protein [Paramuricea clavata]